MLKSEKNEKSDPYLKTGSQKTRNYKIAEIDSNHPKERSMRFNEISIPES